MKIRAGRHSELLAEDICFRFPLRHFFNPPQNNPAIQESRRWKRTTAGSKPLVLILKHSADAQDTAQCIRTYTPSFITRPCTCVSYLIEEEYEKKTRDGGFFHVIKSVSVAPDSKHAFTKRRSTDFPVHHTSSCPQLPRIPRLKGQCLTRVSEHYSFGNSIPDVLGRYNTIYSTKVRCTVILTPVRRQVVSWNCKVAKRYGNTTVVRRDRQSGLGTYHVHLLLRLY